MEITVGTGIDRIVILVYFLLVMGFGAYFGKYSNVGLTSYIKNPSQDRV